MALIRPSNLVNDIRGSVSGVTFSRGLAGAQVSAKRSPRSRKPALSGSTKVPLSSASRLWRSATAQERAEWVNLAKDVTEVNRLGQVVRASAFSLFCKVQLYRIQAGLPQVLGVRINPVPFTQSTINPRIVLGPGQFRRSNVVANQQPDQVLIFGTDAFPPSVTIKKSAASKFLEQRPGSFWLGSNFSCLPWYPIRPKYSARVGSFFNLKIVSLWDQFTWPLVVTVLHPDIDP